MRRNAEYGQEEQKNLPVVTEKLTVAPHKSDDFSGYTLKELRFQRTMTEVRRDYVQEKLLAEFDNIRTLRFLQTRKEQQTSGGWINPAVMALAGKAFKLFSYTDYISLGLSLFQGGKKLISLFRRRKKK